MYISVDIVNTFSGYEVYIRSYRSKSLCKLRELCFGVLIIEQIPVASRSEERVFGRWLDGIVGSNLAG